MKTLHLLRHAKSAWNEPGLADHDRGLNARGRRDAPLMGAALCSRITPMPVAVSTARRAQLTLNGLCENWPLLRDYEHRDEPCLYTFDFREVLSWVAGQADTEPALFLIGHNPALTDLVNYLIGREVLENLPTAGYVQLSLRIALWADVAGGCGSLESSLFARQIRPVDK
jgi:phosphohistidine phosphatase